jgi:hypothetical protein
LGKRSIRNPASCKVGNKKDPSKADESLVVNVVESNWNDILMEFRRLYHLMRGLSLA